MSLSDYIKSWIPGPIKPWIPGTQENNDYHVDNAIEFARLLAERKGEYAMSNFDTFNMNMRECQRFPDRICKYSQDEFRDMADRISPGLGNCHNIRKASRILGYDCK